LIEWLTYAFVSRLDVVLVSLPGAAQDRLPAHVPGTRGKAGTLITTLVDFKTFFDANAPLQAVLPQFTAARPQVYGNQRLRDLCLFAYVIRE